VQHAGVVGVGVADLVHEKLVPVEEQPAGREEEPWTVTGGSGRAAPKMFLNMSGNTPPGVSRVMRASTASLATTVTSGNLRSR
jgi:hypothetical protein